MMVPLSSKVSITCKDVWHFPIVQWHGFRGSTLTTNSIQAATTLGWNPGYLSMGLFFRANEIRVHLGLSKPGPAWPHHNQTWCDLWAGLIQILFEISLHFEILGNMLKVGDYMIISPLYSFKMQPYPTQKYGYLTPIWVNPDDPVLQEGREIYISRVSSRVLDRLGFTLMQFGSSHGWANALPDGLTCMRWIPRSNIFFLSSWMNELLGHA